MDTGLLQQLGAQQLSPMERLKKRVRDKHDALSEHFQCDELQPRAVVIGDTDAIVCDGCQGENGKLILLRWPEGA